MDIGQLAERIGVERGVDHVEARGFVDDVFRAMAIAIHAGDAVTVPGLGRVVVSEDEPEAIDKSFATLGELHRASGELLAVASRAADAAKRRGDEIDLGIAQIRRVMAGAA